ncbi:MAG: GntR family transcriptional regulator [Burkholderiales bacterium]|nr:MAG: GntR family transcriptional regulator [Burkholderiales bacterium]
MATSPATDPFELNPQGSTPLYRQIVEQVQRRVAGGLWQPGDELPSVRAVADRHAINPMTVSKAYSLLEAEGVLERRRGVGMAVAAHPAGLMAVADRLDLLAPALEALVRQARQLGVPAADLQAALQQRLDQEDTP